MAGNPNPITTPVPTDSLGLNPKPGSAIAGLEAGGGLTPISGTPRNLNADKLNAGLESAQYNEYLGTYVPFENQALKEAQDPNFFNKEIDQAAQGAQQSSDSAAATTTRDLGRYGLTLTPDQQTELNRIRKFGATTDVVNATNTTRDAAADQRLGLQETLAGVGQQQAAGAGAVLGQSASQAAQRNITNDQIKAQNQAAVWNTIGTVASVAALIAF